MDWTASGIRNTFAYELGPVHDLYGSLGFIDGVTKAVLTDDYDSAYRQALALDMDGADVPLDALVRVHHYAELGGEVFHEVMGTFMQDRRSASYAYGRQIMSMDLYSTMLALGTYLRKGDKSVKKGTNRVDWFESVVAGAHQFPLVSSNIDGTKLTTKNRTWESGTSALSECNTIAKACSGRVEPDEMGHVCMVRYVNPYRRSVSGTMPSGEDSITLIGVDMATPDIVNKVVITYEQGKKRFFSAASVGSTHPWHASHIGRVSAQNLVMDDIPDGEVPERTIQEMMDQAARDHLAEVSDGTRDFSVDMLYLPWRTGHAYDFVYKDNADDPGIRAKCILASRQVNLDETMRMACTFKTVEEYEDDNVA